jgi:hypothetical protein
MALEALKGIKTIQQIAKDFEIHRVQVSEWKKVSVSAVHVGANVGGAGRRLEGGSRSRSASLRLSGGRRGLSSWLA